MSGVLQGLTNSCRIQVCAQSYRVPTFFSMHDSHAVKVSCASKHSTNTSAVANVACALRLQKELVRVRSGTSCAKRQAEPSSRRTARGAQNNQRKLHEGNPKTSSSTSTTRTTQNTRTRSTTRRDPKQTVQSKQGGSKREGAIQPRDLDTRGDVGPAERSRQEQVTHGQRQSCS